MTFLRSTFALLVALFPAIVMAGSVFDPAGPFREDEGLGTPATCATLGHWIGRAPHYRGRITMTVTGEIVESHSAGAVAYLMLCAPEDIQVMCVTHQAQEVGKTVTVAGAYIRAGDRQVMLDPCLTYPADEGT